MRFARDVFSPRNRMLRQLIAAGEAEAARVAVFVDSGVCAAWPNLPEQISEYAMAHACAMRLAGPIRRVVGGEACKNRREVFDRICRQLSDAGICRQSYVIAVGGGAVLDCVGFAASVVHRGVRLIRVPTTTLAQADSGVGVKNGINALGSKNSLGCFSVPWGVLCDEALTQTLSARDWLCGFAEVIKVGLVKDASLFRYVERHIDDIRDRKPAAHVALRRSAALHVRHITRGGDPFEMTAARPLDFGHWAAHRLEQMSGYRIRHGEAVSIGMALDTVHSVLAGWLDEEEGDRVIGCLASLGLPIYHRLLADSRNIWRGLEQFREHLGGELTVAMLDGIGKSRDVHELSRGRVAEAIARLHAIHAGAGRGR